MDDGRTIATKNEITETLLIPTECIPRILGYEGGIHQKLEFQSNAKIDIDSMGQHVGPRPVTSSITAHRLVAGALGVSPKMEEMKLQLEKEKLEVAREMAVRYKMSTRQREVKLSGSAEAVSTARRLIDEIVNYTTTLEVDLPGFTMDAILDAAGVKLETIETLLNVIFKLEEQEDERIILYISGDKSSCEDAKALVFEQLGNLKFSPGLLVRMPLSLSSILTSQEKANSFTNKMTELCGASVRPLKFQDQFCFFLHGSSSKTCQAEDLLNKVNTELVFNRNQWEKVFESENDDESDFSLTLDYLLILMDEIAHGDPKKFTESIVEESTPMISDTRDVLLQCRNSSHAKRLPLELRIILQAEGHCDFIVDTEFSPTRSFSTDSHELNFLDQS